MYCNSLLLRTTVTGHLVVGKAQFLKHVRRIVPVVHQCHCTTAGDVLCSRCPCFLLVVRQLYSFYARVYNIVADRNYSVS